MSGRYLKNQQFKTKPIKASINQEEKPVFIPDTDNHYFKMLEDHFPKEQIERFKKVRSAEDFAVYCRELRKR